MRAGLLLPVVIGLLAGVAPAAARAQTLPANPVAPFVGRTVTSVAIEIEGRSGQEPGLLEVVEGLRGRPFTRIAWRPLMSRLVGLGQFDDVELLASADGPGVALVFRLLPRHPVDRLQITGNTGIPVAELVQLLTRRYGGVPTTASIDEVADTVESLLFEQGYRTAVVTPSTVETHNPDRATLVLDTEAGPPAIVASIDVLGESPLDDNTIRSRAGVVVGQRYRSRDVQTNMLAIAASLREDRYYEATALPRFVPRGDDGQGDVTLLVQAGPRVELSVEGELPGPIEELIPLARERSADIDLLQDSQRRVEAALRGQGFRDAEAPFRRDVSADGSTVTITYDVRRGSRYRIDLTRVTGVDQSLQPAVEQVFDLPPGAPFSAQAVSEASARLRALLRLQGYYQADAVPSYQFPGPDAAGDERVVVELAVTTGPRAEISEVAFDFGDTQSVSEFDLLAVMESRVGQPYVAARNSSDALRVERLYGDRGFRTAAAVVSPEIAEDDERVRLVVSVVEGPQIVVGSIDVVGNQAISSQAVLETLTLRPGSPLGDAALVESRRRLIDLGIFRQVTIEPPRTLPGEVVWDLVVSVQELPNNTLGFGGGLEVRRRPRAATADGQTDVLEFTPRGFFEIGRRNLGGRNRQVNLFSRVALKPRLAGDEEEGDSRFGFTEYRVAGTFREQRAFQTDTNVLVGLTFEQGVRTLYNFARRAVSAEALRRLSPELSVSGRWSLDFSRLFDVGILEEDRSPIDRLFPQVRLSLLATGVVWDRRNDAIAPSAGSLLAGDLEFAVRSIGSEVGYAKLFLQVSEYRTVAGTDRLVLATRAQLGVARGLERIVEVEDEFGEPVIGLEGRPVTEVVADLPASQRFFAGGGTTVRGFQIDRLGVDEILNDNGLSNGGNAVVVLNAELRAFALRLLGRDLGVVGFVDAGNVFAKTSDLDLTRLRSALGFGLRYDSPLGPLRLDFGFKTSRQLIGGRRERGWEYHLSIGEAF